MGWINGMDGWMEGRKDGWMVGWMEGRKDGWMSRWMDGWVDRWRDGWMNSERGHRVKKLMMNWDMSVQAPSFILPLGRIGGHALSQSLSC